MGLADLEKAIAARHGQSLELGETLYINLGGATAPSAVCVTGLYLQVQETSEKAVRVQCFNQRGELRGPPCWFPRKAMIEEPRVPEGSILGARLTRTFKLAPWFRPDEYAAKFIEKGQIVGGSSKG